MNIMEMARGSGSVKITQTGDFTDKPTGLPDTHHEALPSSGVEGHAPDSGSNRSILHRLFRRCQLASGVILLIYLFLHLVNHALGIGSLDLAGRGLMLALRIWRSAPGTVLLYGAASMHFLLALRTIYGRRHWALPPTEWLRLWAGLSLPLLLIRHAVSTRLASSLYGFEPNYERVVIALIASGTQGLQLALLAPGWLHGCLGLWLRMRHFELARRAKPALLALMVLMPLLSAAGFMRMKQAVLAMNLGPLRPDSTLMAHQMAIETWRDHILVLYLGLLVSACMAGQLRNWLERRRLCESALLTTRRGSE